MNMYELKEILEKHNMWLNNEVGGQRANLENINLKNANLEGANLRFANLRNANLENVNLKYANLRNVDLRNADLICANLSYANLENANLGFADFKKAKLEGANLTGANLDFSAFPLWCSSFDMIVDDNLVGQLLYHIMRLENPIAEKLKNQKKYQYLRDVANASSPVVKHDCDKIKPEIEEE